MLVIVFLTIITAIISSVYSPVWVGFIVLFFGFILYVFQRKEYKGFFGLTLIFFIFFTYTFFVIQAKHNDYQEMFIKNNSVRLYGKVKNIYNYGFLYKITEDSLFSGKELIVYKNNHGFIPGDYVKVDGELLIEENINRLTLLTKPPARILPRQVIKVEESKLKWIFDIKSKFILNVKKHIPEYYANFLIGLLIGVNGIDLDSNLQEVFLNLGLLHMLVVSGAQVALLTSVLLRMLAVFHLPKTGKFIIVLLFNSVFLLFVGGDISVLRAVIMMQITIFLNYDNRSKTSLQVLALTGIAMLSFSPGMVFSLGFILSFCATFAVVEVSPRIQKMLGNCEYIPDFLKEPLGVSLGPILVTSPIIFLINRRFDVLALFANMLFGPIVEVVVIIGFLGMVLSVLVSILAIPVLKVTFGLMVIMKTVADILYVFPWRSMYFRQAFVFNVVAYYIVFFTWLYHKELFRKYWHSWLSLLVVIVFMNYWFLSKLPEKELYFYNAKNWFSILYVTKSNSLMIVSEANEEEQKKFRKRTIQTLPSTVISLKAKEDNANILSMNGYKLISLGEIVVCKVASGFLLEDNGVVVNIILDDTIKEKLKGIVFMPLSNRIKTSMRSIGSDIVIYAGKETELNIIANKRGITSLFIKDNKYHLYQQN